MKKMSKVSKSFLWVVSSLALVLTVSHTAFGQDDGDWTRSGNVLFPANPTTDRVGIGTTTPETRLHVGGDVQIEKSGSPKLFIWSRGNGTQRYSIRATNNQDNAGGRKLIIRNEDQNRDDLIITPFGTVGVRVLEITGGTDLAEPFKITGVESIMPGMVVNIDPEHPGQLLIADKAYDRTVAGIVSGANGLNPGLTMKQEGSEPNGNLPVALTGRVYCLAGVSNGSIQPGDLLTTSDTPGHAMKVTDYAKAQGAIIGKAMSSLETGRGMVLVLVTLQ